MHVTVNLCSRFDVLFILHNETKRFVILDDKFIVLSVNNCYNFSYDATADLLNTNSFDL
jgi:hypothetical protein